MKSKNALKGLSGLLQLRKSGHFFSNWLKFANFDVAEPNRISVILKADEPFF